MPVQEIIKAVKRISTETAAAKLQVKPQTMRAGYCRDGHYLGVVPTKARNRFLHWDDDKIEAAANGESL